MRGSFDDNAHAGKLKADARWMQRSIGKALQLSILLLHGVAVWRAASEGTPEAVEAALREMKNTSVLHYYLDARILTDFNP